MAQPIESRIRDLLSEFLARSGGDVTGVVLSRGDGLPVAYVLPTGDPKLVSAMWALAAGSIKRLGEELKIGSGRYAVLTYEHKNLIVYRVKDLYLLALANPNANLGLILLEMERLQTKISEII